ncbi:MAG: YcbK family protein [Gammaproteobacteria bacterium]
MQRDHDDDTYNHPKCHARRRFLAAAGAGVAAGLVAPAAFATVHPRAHERALAFYNLHTGERLKATYFADNEYQLSSLQEINHLLRDFRTGQVHPIDERLLDLLYVLRHRLDSHRPVHVISGFRSPKTNAMLRARSHEVAKHSLHMDGMAIDIRVPGRSLNTLHRAALALRGGGVGYYPHSDFVHVDVGRVRHWSG